MEFVHHDLGRLSAGTVVEVEIRERANVRLVDASNFNSYRNGRQYRFFGGQALRTPLRLEVPHADHWHVVIDFGGGAGQVHSSIRVLNPVS
jgi:hypothetical protein